jgi:hypothetical protein
MRKYINDKIADQWKEYCDKVLKPINTIIDIKEKLDHLRKVHLNLEQITIPTTGEGFVYAIYNNIDSAHIVYYKDGWIYDDNFKQNGKIAVGKLLAKLLISMVM